MSKNSVTYSVIACSSALCLLSETAMTLLPLHVAGGGKPLIINGLQSSCEHFNQRILLNETERTSVIPVSLRRLWQLVKDIAHQSPAFYTYFLTFHPMACRWQGSGEPSFSEDRRQESEARMRLTFY